MTPETSHLRFVAVRGRADSDSVSKSGEDESWPELPIEFVMAQTLKSVTDKFCMRTQERNRSDSEAGLVSVSEYVPIVFDSTHEPIAHD